MEIIAELIKDERFSSETSKTREHVKFPACVSQGRIWRPTHHLEIRSAHCRPSRVGASSGSPVTSLTQSAMHWPELLAIGQTWLSLKVFSASRPFELMAPHFSQYFDQFA